MAVDSGYLVNRYVLLAVVVAVLWGILFYRYRQSFTGLFVLKAA